MTALVERITEVLLANSFGKFKDETGDGFSAYAAHVAELIGAEVQTEITAEAQRRYRQGAAENSWHMP